MARYVRVRWRCDTWRGRLVSAVAVGGSGGGAGDPDPLVGDRDAVAAEHVAAVGMDHDLARDEDPL